jgi:hypothetical protein
MHKTSPRISLSLAAITAAITLAGCANVNIPGLGSGKTETAAPAAAPAPAPAGPKIGPGMNAQGEVVDAKKVEAGFGQKVKGINDWEGEITGKPAPGSKFTQLKIGMPMKQVLDLVGTPTDQGSYMTGKAWIPFNFGSDRYRHEAVYKGQGRLVFAGAAGFDSSASLIWIIHSATEPGYR